MRSIFKYNFKTSSREDYNPCRVYTLNDEAGLIICVWLDGKYKPMIPLPYSQETQNGYEYTAAIQMVQIGLIKEGMTAIGAIRDRYDGEKRNPWNEIEYGSNYARSMASYALLNTFAGFEFDMVQGKIGFDPIQPNNDRFKCFWSLDSGWGQFEMSPGLVKLRLLYGQFSLNLLKVPNVATKSVQTVTLAGQSLPFTQNGASIQFQEQAAIKEKQVLEVIWDHSQ